MLHKIKLLCNRIFDDSLKWIKQNIKFGYIDFDQDSMLVVIICTCLFFNYFMINVGVFAFVKWKLWFGWKLNQTKPLCLFLSPICKHCMCRCCLLGASYSKVTITDKNEYSITAGTTEWTQHFPHYKCMGIYFVNQGKKKAISMVKSQVWSNPI